MLIQDLQLPIDDSATAAFLASPHAIQAFDPLWNPAPTPVLLQPESSLSKLLDTNPPIHKVATPSVLPVVTTRPSTPPPNPSSKHRSASERTPDDSSPPSKRQKTTKVVKSVARALFASSVIGKIVGNSKSAVRDQKIRGEIKEGSFVLKKASMRKMEAKVFAVDPHAIIDAITASSVICSKCQKSYALRAPYQAGRFTEHAQKCTSSSSRPSAQFMTSFLKPKGKLAPCPGLVEAEFPEIAEMVTGNLLGGGGSEGLAKVADKLYGVAYNKLTMAQKTEVREWQKKNQDWKVSKDTRRVYSAKCALSSPSYLDSSVIRPCQPCLDLFKNSAFRSALTRERSTEVANFKYTPHVYTQQAVGIRMAEKMGLGWLVDRKAPTAQLVFRFVKAAPEGSWDHLKAFFGMLEALVESHERERRGKGMQNFRWNPDWDQLCHMILLNSPRSYKQLVAAIPARSQRSFQSVLSTDPFMHPTDLPLYRRIRAETPRFTLGITPFTFERPVAHLAKLLYNGPVILGCDDTKLHPDYRTFWDNVREKWTLVGAIGDPIVIDNAEGLEEILKDPTLQKATKVCLSG